MSNIVNFYDLKRKVILESIEETKRLRGELISELILKNNSETISNIEEMETIIGILKEELVKINNLEKYLCEYNQDFIPPSKTTKPQVRVLTFPKKVPSTYNY